MAHWTIESITERVQMNTQLQLGLKDLSDLINSITIQHTLMNKFAMHDDVEPSTLDSFAEWTVAPNNLAIQGLLDKLHFLIVGSPDLAAIGNTGILYQIADSLEVKNINLFYSIF